MNWTKQKPATPGYYWLRNYRTTNDLKLAVGPVIVKVHQTLDLPFDAYFCGNDGAFAVAEIEGEWCGPVLVEPTSEPAETAS